MENTWIILLPTIVTVLLCLWTKKVYLGMFVGIVTGSIILSGGNPLTGLTLGLDKLIAVFASGWNMKIILFAIIIGGLIELLAAAGGVRGMIRWFEEKTAVKDKKGAQVFTWLLGVLLFFDQVTSEAVTATVGRGLADNYKYSREKVAYLVDSTASPMCALLPLNSWGAYIIGLLSVLSIANPMGTMIKALPFNFYSIVAIILCFIVARKDWNIGPMKKAEENLIKVQNDVKIEQMENQKVSSPGILIIPLLVLLVCVPIFLYITGDGVVTNGNASTAVFWGVLVGTITAFLMTLKVGLSYKEATAALKKGIIDMLPIGMLLVFAFALSSICSELGVGDYIARLTSLYLPNQIMPAMIMITSALMAFSTGSSWGTFAIMIPIIVPMATTGNMPLNILLAAMLSGAIMGDHCSIMSDSTVMASIFSGCDNINHFKTQIPYALISCTIAGVLFLISGFIFL